LTWSWHTLHYTKVIKNAIAKAEEIRKRNMSTKKEKKTHPGAIYTSRLMPNISKGKKFLNKSNYNFI